MKTLIIACFVALFAFLFQCGERRGVHKLSSGKQIEVYDVSQLKDRKSGVKTLAINYQTDLLDSNSASLRQEAEQVWNDLFKVEAENAGIGLGTVRAYPFDGKNIHYKKATEFVIERKSTSDWYIKNILTQNSSGGWEIKNVRL